MKIVCPLCGAQKVVTFKQVDSGKSITCSNCGEDMHLPGWQIKQKGEQK